MPDLMTIAGLKIERVIIPSSFVATFNYRIIGRGHTPINAGFQVSSGDWIVQAKTTAWYWTFDDADAEQSSEPMVDLALDAAGRRDSARAVLVNDEIRNHGSLFAMIAFHAPAPTMIELKIGCIGQHGAQLKDTTLIATKQSDLIMFNL